jgi:hypothetical protein
MWDEIEEATVFSSIIIFLLKDTETYRYTTFQNSLRKELTMLACFGQAGDPGSDPI